MNWKVLILSSTVNAGNVKETRGNIEYQKNYFNTQKKLQYSVLSKKKNGLIYRVMIYNFNLISLLLLWIIFIQVISFLSPSFPFLSPPSFSLPSFLSSSGSCDDGKRNGIYKFY